MTERIFLQGFQYAIVVRVLARFGAWQHEIRVVVGQVGLYFHHSVRRGLYQSTWAYDVSHELMRAQLC